jgi:hypothetical protein
MIQLTAFIPTLQGKTVHTWAFDQHPDLPLGPPNVMMSYTGESVPRLLFLSLFSTLFAPLPPDPSLTVNTARTPLSSSFFPSGQIPSDLVDKRDSKWGLSTPHKRELRSGPDGYLTRDYSIAGKGGDQFEQDGKVRFSLSPRLSNRRSRRVTVGAGVNGCFRDPVVFG